jgi:hypothetical protein
VEHPFVYPPATLPLFGFLAHFDFLSIYYGFLFAKACALAALLWLWRRHFVPRMGLLFAAFVLVAYNAAAYVDLRVGNVSLFEEVLLWAAFASLMRGRKVLFSLLILLASWFKLTPILFLGLLLFERNVRSRILAMGSLAAFAGVQALASFLMPGTASGFVASLRGVDESGVLNPSSLGLAQDLVRTVAGSAVHGVAAWLAALLFAGWVVVAVWWTWRAARTLPHDSSVGVTRDRIILACLLVALVLPRLKTYSYILLLVPTYLAVMPQDSDEGGRLSTKERLRRAAALVILTGVSSLYVFSLGSTVVADTLLAYSPLVAALVAWWIVTGRALRRETDRGSGVRSTAPAQGAAPESGG